MKLFALFALLITSVSTAAPWDGTKGPLTVVTFTFSSGTGTNLPGVPIVAGPLVWHTTIFIKCSDPSVTAARVRVSYRDGSGDHTVSLLADFANGYGGITLPIPQEQITDTPRFVELREGATY